MSSVTLQRSVEDKDDTPDCGRAGGRLENKGISICTFMTINLEFQIRPGSSSEALRVGCGCGTK